MSSSLKDFLTNKSSLIIIIILVIILAVILIKQREYYDPAMVGKLTVNDSLAISSLTSSDSSNNQILVNSPLIYANKLKPIILPLIVGNVSTPIVDLSSNAYPSNTWMCKLLSYSGNIPIVGIRNGYWWINSRDDNWHFCIIEFTPISMYNIQGKLMDSKNGVNLPNVSANAFINWIGPYYPNDYNSYLVFDTDGKGKTPPKTALDEIGNK